MDASPRLVSRHLGSSHRLMGANVRWSRPPKRDELRPMGLCRSLVDYLGVPLVTGIGAFGFHEKHGNRVARLARVLPYGLSSDVLSKIARMNVQSLKRLTNTVESIKDALIGSTPELIREYHTQKQYTTLMKWAYSLATHNADKVTSQWKAFGKLLKWRALKSETEQPEIPSDLPGFGSECNPDTLPEFWSTLCPWLSLVWRGVESKLVSTRLMHFLTSRGFPAGGKETRTRARAKHADTLFATPEISPVREKILDHISYLIGKFVKGRMKPTDRSNGHISLTSSASFGTTVQDGGRVAGLRPRLREWLLEEAKETVTSNTWFGQPYRLIKGVPRWQTMCRPEHIRVDTGFEYAESAIIEHFDLEKYSDPLYGLDTYTGYQLLQFSIEECLDAGVLCGSPSTDGDRLELGDQASLIRVSAIGEPGAKCRIVTVGEDFVTQCLQPFSHHLLEKMRCHPSAWAGLSFGAQLYEWVKGLRNTQPLFGEKMYFLSSDLETATDYCTHQYSKSMLQGFVRGTGDETSPYIMACIGLLCSPRKYTDPLGHVPMSETTRGILMADPGTKLVLTLHNLVAEAEAFLRWYHKALNEDDDTFLARISRLEGIPTAPWRHFACTGDDHIGQGPIGYLRRITENHVLNGMKVSRTTNFISPIGAFYCEEMLCISGLNATQIWGNLAPLHEREYLSHPHVDALKLRLISPCMREFMGKDEPNPAIGKASALRGNLAWLGGGWEVITPLISARFETRMSAFLPEEKYIRYLPKALGGLEVPAFHLTIEELDQVFSRIPRVHLSSILEVLGPEGPDTEEGKAASRAKMLVRRCLEKFSTNVRARGVLTNEIEEQIRESLKSVFFQGMTLEELRATAGVPADDWAFMGYRAKCAVAKRLQLIPISQALSIIDRPYTFRNLLAPEISLRHGIVVDTKAYDAEPWDRRILSFYKNLGEIHKEAEIDNVCLNYLVKHLASKVVERGFADYGVISDTYFIPEDVVVNDTMCTLRTPI